MGKSCTTFRIGYTHQVTGSSEVMSFYYAPALYLGKLGQW